ncbi:hypothetical protein [Candidatus Nucleicultrix amoebiphila]|uniref:hypothetical protein n=1 Tax=Candidatus Nucleicultrix amoebiphila TaxID=1509244 RepID=UPI000A27207C|nr:hypothetical protein [Candidatus Nucleicultrix amoebiphila]
MASNLLIDEPPLQVLPTLAKKVGLNEAIILQQMHYWLNPNHNKNLIKERHWVYNSYDEWQQQFPFWSKETVKRTITSLEKQEIIYSEKLSDHKFNHRKWYTINYEQLQAVEKRPDRSGQNDPIEKNNLTRSEGSNCTDHYIEQRILTEITQKNTPEGCAPSSEIMINFWNEVIEQKSRKVHLTPKRSYRLEKLLKSHFASNEENWTAYCSRIALSPFLMGKGKQGWKVTLDWATDPQNIQKIFEGNFDGEDYKQKVFTEHYSEQNALEVIHSIKNDPNTKVFLNHLIQEIGCHDFMNFFTRTRVLEVKSNRATLSVSKEFYVTYLPQKFYQNILSSLKAVESEIEFFDLVFVQPEELSNVLPTSEKLP